MHQLLLQFIQQNGHMKTAGIIACVIIAIYFAMKFILEFEVKSKTRKESFVIEALKLKNITQEIDEALQERMLQVLFQHETGITTNSQNRDIFKNTVKNSNGNITFNDIRDSIYCIEVLNGKIEIKSRLYILFFPIFYSTILLLCLITTIISPSTTTGILLLSYALISIDSFKKRNQLIKLKNFTKTNQ